MDIRDRRGLKAAAREDLAAASYEPRKLILIHTGVTVVLALIIGLLDYLLEQQIGGTGGLGGVGTRSMLETVRTLLTMVLALRLLRIVGIFLAPNLPVFFIITCIGGFNNGIAMFASVEFINSIVHDGERVRSQSLLSFTNTFGSVVGTAISGVVIDVLGLNMMLGCGSVVVACSFVIMLLCGRLHRRDFGNV